MIDEKATQCARCNNRAETYHFESDSTFWGGIETTEWQTTERKLRVFSTYFRRDPKVGSPLLKSDETFKLCADCWGLLVGSFLQGKSVPCL